MKIIGDKRQRLLFVAITALGISSIITQIIVIREFLSVFYGNELVFGIILANWLLLVGVGAYLGKYFEKGKISWLVVFQVIIAFLPFFHIFVIRNLRNFIFLSGELVGVFGILFSSFFVLLPYCLISGFLLTLACLVFSSKGDSIGKVYFIDNIGDILGGMLFSFVFVYFLNHFQIAFLLMIVNLVAALLLSGFIRRRFLVGFISVLIVISIIGFVFIDLNRVTREGQYKGQELLFDENTVYGNIVVTKSGDQLNFYENGMALFTTSNVIANEEVVHYAMVQREDVKDVLLISGGVSGTVNEIFKYDVDKVDYVELDPLLIEVGKSYTSNLEYPRLNIINKDGRLFVKQSSSSYDVVIVDLPDPSTAQVNRFYTVEFFREVKKVVGDGVLSLSLSGSANYLNIETRKLNSVIYNSLKKYFKEVIVIPGDENFFIASDNKLSYDIVDLVNVRGVETKYVNEFYLKGKLSEERIDYFMGSLIKDAGENKDFSPISYYYHLLNWVRQFRFNFTLFFVVLFVLVIVYLSRLKVVPFALFTSGFAAASLEVVLLIGFQILYGYAYRQIAVIITSFMLGLAIGSYYMNKRIKEMGKKEFVNLEYSIFFYSMLLPLILFLLSKVRWVFIGAWLVMPAFTVLIAVLVGMEFPLAAKLFFKGKVGERAGKLYSADLIGACVGALLVSALLIPILGLFKVCFLVGVLNLVSGLVVKFN